MSTGEQCHTLSKTKNVITVKRLALSRKTNATLFSTSFDSIIPGNFGFCYNEVLVYADLEKGGVCLRVGMCV